jgi:hypothetical protein
VTRDIKSRQSFRKESNKTHEAEDLIKKKLKDKIVRKKSFFLKTILKSRPNSNQANL